MTTPKPEEMRGPASKATAIVGELLGAAAVQLAWVHRVAALLDVQKALADAGFEEAASFVLERATWEQTHQDKATDELSEAVEKHLGVKP